MTELSRELEIRARLNDILANKSTAMTFIRWDDIVYLLNRAEAAEARVKVLEEDLKWEAGLKNS